MGVTETTDSYLFLQVAENPYVILKYHSDECGAKCKQFIPIYHDLSMDKKYSEVVFLTINADNNPAAKRHIMDKMQPVITIYFQGQLLDSRHESSKEGVITLLGELLTKKIERKTE